MSYDDVESGERRTVSTVLYVTDVNGGDDSPVGAQGFVDSIPGDDGGMFVPA